MAEALTTRPGYVNPQRQKVLRRVPWVDGGMDGQYVYVLRCIRAGCGYEYGEEGIRVHQRRCPRCGDGAPGLHILEEAPTLFSSDMGM
jgi:hypothetical protein